MGELALSQVSKMGDLKSGFRAHLRVLVGFMDDLRVLVGFIDDLRLKVSWADPL